MNLINNYTSTTRRKPKTSIHSDPKWLRSVTVEDPMKLTGSFGEKLEVVIVPGATVRLKRAIKLSKGNIPQGTPGVVIKSDGCAHVVKFAEKVILEVADSDLRVTGHLNSRVASHMQIPDRKRVVPSNKYADRYIIYRIADKLTQLVSSVNMYGPELHLIRSYRNVRDQGVNRVDFKIDYADRNNIRYTVGTSVMVEDGKIILPETFTTAAGVQAPFTKEAIEALSYSMKEPTPPLEPHVYNNYMHEDLARIRTATVDVTKRRVKSQTPIHSELTKFIMAGVLNPPDDNEDKKDDSTEEEFNPYMDALPAKNTGFEFKFKKDNYRDVDTGIPSTDEPDDFTIEKDKDDITRDYPTMDGRDDERSKADRIEDATFTGTTSTFDPFRVVKGW